MFFVFNTEAALNIHLLLHLQHRSENLWMYFEYYEISPQSGSRAEKRKDKICSIIIKNQLKKECNDKVVDEIREQYVVQAVTDNEPALKAASKMLMRKRKHLYWIAYSAHCINLMLKDVANKKSVTKVIKDGKTITNFIYNSGWVLDLMKKFTGDRELIRPTITQFATNFVAIKSIVRYKQQLRAMFNSNEWKNSR
ncbi:hypothetical protein ACSBR1_013149 [Camellia fascicularis]